MASSASSSDDVDALGRHGERVGHLLRVGALLDAGLEPDGRLGVVGRGDQHVDEAREPLLGERRLRGAHRGRGAPERLEHVEHRRGVARALVGVLLEQPRMKLSTSFVTHPRGALLLGASGALVTCANAASVAVS